MSPKVFLVLIVAAIVAAFVYLMSDDLFSAYFGKDIQDQAVENLGITKAGRPRPSD
jgi:hypothetical protein